MFHMKHSKSLFFSSNIWYNVHVGNELCKNQSRIERLLADAAILADFYRAKPVNLESKAFQI